MTTSIDEIGVSRCTGCFGCQSACSTGAMSLLLDEDGFYKPIVEREACNDCGACRRRCPVIECSENTKTSEQWPQPSAFAAWTNDDGTRLSSSSGGIFSELAHAILEKGGKVSGCVWGEGWCPEHVLTSAPGDVARMRGSKYVPSRVGDAYRAVLGALQSRGGPVLFSGAPCQVAAMERALSPRQRKGVLLVDFICHGVPSLRVFHRYMEELFDGDDVVTYTFRDKSLGWQTVKAISAGGAEHRVPLASDAFGRGFAVEHLFNMEACYACPFARLPRAGDITLGDFWGCPDEFRDRKGVSAVLANTAAGLGALESLVQAGRIELKATHLAAVEAGNPRATGGVYPVPQARRAFLDGIAGGKSFAQLASTYYPGRVELAWRAFRASGSKTRFILETGKRLLQRLLQRAADGGPNREA